MLLTGDGGQADMDQAIAARLAASTDLGRIVNHYTVAWQREQVIIVGCSFGANAAALFVNRLASPARSLVAGVVLLGPPDAARFEFHVASWPGGSGDSRYRTVPEIERLSEPVTRVFANDEPDSVCRALRGPRLQSVAVGKGRHFSGEYDRLVELMLK
jgi:type IV secretory pathway VirJ component